MQFAMRNVAATFQRQMNQCLLDLPSVELYVDGIVIYSDTWEEHLCRDCKLCYIGIQLDSIL